MDLRVYFDFRDWWVGYYRGPHHHYVCPLPTVVIRWPRAATRRVIARWLHDNERWLRETAEWRARRN